MLNPVGTEMGDLTVQENLPQYIMSHPCQLSLAILLWVDANAMSTGTCYGHR